MLPTRRSQNWLPGIFNDFFGNEWMEKSTSPAINIIENDKEYKVELAAPGLTKEDFNVRVTEENQLVVTMEKKQEQKDEQQDGRYLRREFSYSKYQQTLLLPDNVEQDKITASVQHGVLNILIPKVAPEAEKPQERSIEIQ
jgi:HSP20 family protein